MKTTITTKSYRHSRETPIADSNCTRVKVSVTPGMGRRFSRQGMDQAARRAAVVAFELGAAYLRALPEGTSYCLPAVGGGDTCSECASTFVTIEHDGDAAVIATLQQITQQALR